MARSALEIIEEYVVDPEARIRRNAVTALAALDSDEGVDRVVDLALKDTDGSVRDRAVNELRELCSDRDRHASA